MHHVLIDIAVRTEHLERLRAMPGVRVTTVDPVVEARELPAELIRDVRVLACNFPPTNLDDMTSLRMIQIASSGYNHLAGLPLADRGIRVCNAAGVFDAAIAEWNIAMMVNLARDLREMIRHQEDGLWHREPRYQAELRGATVGIWGYGGVGRQTARLAGALGMNVHVMTRDGIRPRHHVYRLPGTGDPDGTLPHRVFVAGQEDAFLRELDFLILTTPLTSQTRGMIGEAQLRTLPKRAFVLNPARGPIIQEQALLQALRDGWIAGAALDTHYAYPLPSDHPLWAFPNVIMTPHIAGSSEMTTYLERVWDILIDNTRRLMHNEPLLNEVPPAKLSS